MAKIKHKDDPGIGTSYSDKAKRMINPDGSFNVRRIGINYSTKNLYQVLINMSWPRFLAMILITYLVMNIIFASIYLFIGIENLHGFKSRETFIDDFFIAFNFSFQTFTTLGYGVLAPSGKLMNSVAAVEALMGFMGFALATGLLYGRFSRPSAELIFSKNILIAPYQEGFSLQFRIANARSNMLMEMEASLIMQMVDLSKTPPERQFMPLELERSKILFFPLSWTIVHPITRESPLHGIKESDLEHMQIEFLVHLKGFDDTFSQTVHKRYSYLHEDLIWNARFEKTFFADDSGDIHLDMDKLGEYVKLA